MNEKDEILLAEAVLLCTVARTQSASAAARSLRSSAATVLRRLSALEAALDVVLFERTTAGLKPTSALHLALPWAERACACAVGMQREIALLERVPIGVVRLAIPPAMARLMVVPALGSLAARAPGVTLELAAANAVVDMEGREADLALRGVRPDRGELVVKRLAQYSLVVVTSPALATTWDGDPQSLPWLDWDASMRQLPEARWLREAVPDARVVFRASDLESLLEAARRGTGVLVVAEPLAALAGGLVKLRWNGAPLPQGELWLVAHQVLRDVPRVAVVWDWLLDHLAELDRQVSLSVSWASNWEGAP